MKKIVIILGLVLCLVLICSTAIYGQSVNPVRTINGQLVTVTFTAPANGFNSIGLDEIIPQNARGTIISSNPPADYALFMRGEIYFIWFGSYATGQTFTATYRVNQTGSINGTLEYYIADAGPHVETVQNQVKKVPIRRK
jgi:hypothetical protein